MKTALRFCILFVFIYLANTRVMAQQPYYILYGLIQNSETGRPIPNASISILYETVGTVADSLGRYQLKVYRGDLSFKIQSQGYFTKYIRQVVAGDTELNVSLNEKTNQLEEVTVAGDRVEQNVERTEMGVSNLSMKTIKKLPVLLGEADAVKSLLLLPGVTSVGEGASGFNVRGGSTDQNLILLEGMPLLNAFHLMGFFSVFNPDMVRDVNFYRGSVAPAYAGRTSSVLDVNLRDTNLEKWSFRGGLGVISSRMMIEGPLIKEKLGISVAGRYSYVNHVMNLLPNSRLQGTRARFEDLTAKMDYRSGNGKNRFTLTYFQAGDQFKIPDDSLSNLEINAASSTFDWTTNLLAGRWATTFSKGSVRFMGGWSSYESSVGNADSTLAFSLGSAVNTYRLGVDGTYSLTERWRTDAGISLLRHEIQPGNLQPESPVSAIRRVSVPVEAGWESGGYWGTEYEVTPKLSVTGGFRYSFFIKTGPSTQYRYGLDQAMTEENQVDSTVYGRGDIEKSYGGLEPRVALRLKLTDSFSFKVSYNRMIQYIQQISNTTSTLPIARWKLSDVYTKPQQSDQISGGFFKNWESRSIESSVELFYKKVENVTDYKDGADLLLNRFTETVLLQGMGRTYGLEVYIKKRKGTLTGWLSYTYSKTRWQIAGLHEEETINAGQWYAPNFDRPHVLNLVGNYQLGAQVSMGMNIAYSSGRPITYPISKYYVAGRVVPEYLYRNQERIPDYLRVDYSFNLDPVPYSKKKYKGSWNFSIYNVLGIRNPYSVFIRARNPYKQYYNRVYIYKLAVLGAAIPSLSYNFTFN